MARGLPTTGTIYLSQVKNAFGYDTSNVRRTDTFTTAGSSSVAAPSDAVAVKIEVWGGGGGGRGYNSFGAEYGGGGGAYTSIIMPAAAGTTIYYTVGAGGTGGSSGSTNNATSGSDSRVHPNSSFNRMATFYGINANGGGAGSTLVGGGGLFQYLDNLKDFSSSSGSNGTTTAGGNAAGGGGAGGSTSGAAGSAPGGGGAPGLSSGVAGGNGAAGQVKLTWYGLASTTLRSFLAGGTYVRPGAAGATRNIPASGTINLRDFISAEEIGLVNNTAMYYVGSGGQGTIWANCKINANGTIGVNPASLANSGYFQNWMRSILGDDSSTNTQHFDVLFNRTSATGDDTTLYGSTANTWIQCSTEPSWNVKTFLSGYGESTARATGYLAFRRRSDNTVVANLPFYIEAWASDPDPGDTK